MIADEVETDIAGAKHAGGLNVVNAIGLLIFAVVLFLQLRTRPGPSE